MYALHALDHDLWRITLPNPQLHPWLPASRPLNVYLIVGQAPTLINAGHPLQSLALGRALREIGLMPERIERVIFSSWAYHLVGGAQAFPDAQLYMQSADMLAPRDYGAVVAKERDLWQRATEELLEEHGYAQRCDADAVRRFFDAYFPPSLRPLHVTPLRHGHVIRAGVRHLTVLATPGPHASHLSFYEEERGELFSGELTLEGLPDRIDEVQSYLESQQRLMDLNARVLLPNYGPGVDRHRATSRLQRGARFMHNFLMNATAALQGAPRLIDFSEQDLGFKPRDVTRFALTLLAHRAFFEELVRARGVAASGEGLARRYGTDLDAPDAAQRATSRRSSSLLRLAPEDL